MNKTFCVFVLCVLIASRFAQAEDWLDLPGKWSSQSYWSDPKITQTYEFTPFKSDKVAGNSSVRVFMDVAEDRPHDQVELRFQPEKPLDLSQTEAIGLFLKTHAIEGLKLRDVFLCNPGFQKLAVIPGSSLTLKTGEEWQSVTFDLAESRVIDKELPAGKEGEYDRKDVSTICINFVLPKGKVQGEILLDDLKSIPPPLSSVVRKERAEGGFEINTPQYQVTIGAHGYIQSIRAGEYDFLQPAALAGNSNPTGSAIFEKNDPRKTILNLSEVQPQGRHGVLASNEKVNLHYVFREHSFDILFQQTETTGGLGLNFLVADSVVASLDDRTDRGLFRASLDHGQQISSRLMTTAGPVLYAQQHIDGYARVGTVRLPEDRWAWQFLTYGAGVTKLTMRPIAKPNTGEAIGVTIKCANEDFLLPGGEPVTFDLQAKNYSAQAQAGTFAFQICDYLTREVLTERKTPFELAAGESMPIPTDIEFKQPGVYRGRAKVDDKEGNSRTVEWVFTYDFANYAPVTEEPEDFDAFWQKTLSELSEIPMAVKLTPVPEQSDEHSEAFRVSLATLNGRRFHGWYWKPRKEGRYPVRLELPSSGIYTRLAAHVPHGPDYCGMWIAIHGLPVEPDFENRTDDPAAWNYWTHGIESPQTAMWRTIYASMVRAVDFLSSRPEVDATRIMASGGSQGGGLTLILAGLDERIKFAAPAHNGLCRLDWTIKNKPGFWPFDMSAKPTGQTEAEFLHTLSYFDAANFTPRIKCPVYAEVSLLDTVTASGNQIAALTRVPPGKLGLVCDPWESHASSYRGSLLRSQAISRWFAGENPIQNPIKPVQSLKSDQKPSE